jgi:hypothetical protein
MQDIFGGGGGISTTPWNVGLGCHFSLDMRNLSEIGNIMHATKVTVDQNASSTPFLARAYALCFPEFPA